MRTPLALVPLLALAASPVLAQESSRAAVAGAPSVAAASPAAVAPAAPAAVAPAAARPAKTLAGIERHVTRTVTALMRQVAQSRIPLKDRSAINDQLLAVQAQASAAVQAGKAPEGGDLESFSSKLGKDLDAVAGAIDAAARRAQ